MNNYQPPLEENRPWGSFINFLQNEHQRIVTVKILKVAQGQAFSLQRHQNREEQWHIISGKGNITIGDQTSKIIVGQNYFIPINTLHRLESTEEEIVALEISFGEFDEGDIIRTEDRYGRD